MRVDTLHAFWIIDVSLRIFIPVLCLYALKRIEGIGPSGYGLSLTLRGSRIDQYIAICLLCTMLFLVYVIVDGAVRFLTEASTDSVTTRISPYPDSIVAVMYFVTVASVMEEIIFRGVLAAALLGPQRWSAVLYVAVSAVAFTLAHSVSDPAIIVSHLYFGLVAAVMYVLLRNLWPLIIAHFLTNVVVTALFGKAS